MWMKSFVLLLIVFLTDARKKYKCPAEFIFLGHKCYYLSKSMETWHDAHFSCKDMNSTLATISKRSEDKYLRLYLRKKELTPLDWWIGGIYDFGVNRWMWGSSGLPLKYNGFLKITRPEANKWHCVKMDAMILFKWNSENCLEHKHFLCETPAVLNQVESNQILDPYETNMKKKKIREMMKMRKGERLKKKLEMRRRRNEMRKRREQMRYLRNNKLQMQSQQFNYSP